MADVIARKAQNAFIVADNVTRNGGAAWAEGLTLVRNDGIDPFKVGVSTVDGDRVAGIVPLGFQNQPDGEGASMEVKGRFNLVLKDAVTTTMLVELTGDGTGRVRLAITTDVVCAFALEAVAGGTDKICHALLNDEVAQYIKA